MAKTLEQILGYVYLTGLVEDVKTGIPEVLPPEFWSTKTEVPMDSGRYTRMSGVRTTARRVEYGSSPLQRKLQPIGSFDVKLASFAEEIRLNVKDYMSLRGYAEYGPMSRGMQEIERQEVLFKQIFDNTRVAAVHSMLAKGAIYFDSSGNLLPSSSGAALTIDYNINANNLNQLNSAISASWATAGTDILKDIRTVKKRALQLTGYPIKIAAYGLNVPSYIASNTIAKEFLYRNPAMNEKWLTDGGIPPGFGGIDLWIPVYESFYEDADGTNQEWFGNDTVVFMPAIDSSVYELMEGTTPVPTTFQPLGSLGAARGSLADRVGMYSYAVPVDKPVTADLVAGDCFLPVWKVPDALFIADVTP